MWRPQPRHERSLSCRPVPARPSLERIDVVYAGLVDTTDNALLRAAECGREAHLNLLLQRAADRRAYLANARTARGATRLLFSAGIGSDPSARIMRLLLDAGADESLAVEVTNEEGVVVGRDVPLGFARGCLRLKMISGEKATVKQLQRLEGVRRLLMRVEAVHAESRLWI